MHGVFPSSCKKSASSRIIQFHWAFIGDSKEVITPFMQVGTHPTRNFATFGPSELRPPFTGGYNQNRNLNYLALQHRAGVSPYTCSYELAETCVFVKQLLPSFLCQH